jgi:hypothetical protein
VCPVEETGPWPPPQEVAEVVSQKLTAEKPPGLAAPRGVILVRAAPPEAAVAERPQAGAVRAAPPGVAVGQPRAAPLRAPPPEAAVAERPQAEAVRAVPPGAGVGQRRAAPLWAPPPGAGV